MLLATAVATALVHGQAVAGQDTASSVAVKLPGYAKAPQEKTTKEQLASVRLNVGHHRCSGTAVATRGDVTLVISCNHCFAAQPYPGAQFPRASYPIKCQILSNDERTTYEAVAIDGDSSADIAVIVVAGRLATCDIGTGGAAVGSAAVHYGRTSGYSHGRITVYDVSGRVPPDQTQRSTCSSIPGDSGAGVFVGGKYIATLWGRWHTGEQGGTAVRAVLDVIQRSAPLRRDYPELWGSVPIPKDVPALPRSVPPGPDLVPSPGCPGGVCPVPQPSPRFPILRRIIRR